MVSAQEKKSLNEKMSFLKSIPDFNSNGIPRYKLQALCNNLYPISRIKNNMLFKEGDPCKYVFFVRSGEIKICRKVGFPVLGGDRDNVSELLEDPSTGRKKL